MPFCSIVCYIEYIVLLYMYYNSSCCSKRICIIIIVIIVEPVVLERTRIQAYTKNNGVNNSIYQIILALFFCL